MKTTYFTVTILSELEKCHIHIALFIIKKTKTKNNLHIFRNVIITRDGLSGETYICTEETTTFVTLDVKDCIKADLKFELKLMWRHGRK